MGRFRVIFVSVGLLFPSGCGGGGDAAFCADLRSAFDLMVEAQSISAIDQDDYDSQVLENARLQIGAWKSASDSAPDEARTDLEMISAYLGLVPSGESPELDQYDRVVDAIGRLSGSYADRCDLPPGTIY